MLQWFGRLAWVALFALSACGEEPDETLPTEEERGDREPETEPEPAMGEVVWEPCDVGSYSIECALVDVPLDWEDPEGRRIEVFVRKLPTPRPPARGQLWYLVGGPGYGAGEYIALADWFARHGWDAYLMDYRGVGLSTSLDCGEQDAAPQPACMRQLSDEWGEGLRHFSTTGAAMDLGKLIEATRAPGEEVMIVGASYGTFLANRYLHLFPDQADGFVLDGICPPTGCSLHTEKNFNGAVRELLEGCAEDAFCGARIGADPWAWTADLLERLEAGHCSAFYPGQVREAIAGIFAATIRSRELLPVGIAALHRVERCAPDDIEALYRLAEVLWGQGVVAMEGHEQPARSQYLYSNIVFSEFWDDALETDAYRAELEALPFRFSDVPLIEWKNRWSPERYETPDRFKTWAPSSVPMLFLNGNLDFQTAVWDLHDLEAAYTGEKQRFFEMPFTGHGSEHPCPWTLESAFLMDPHGPLPAACLEEMRAIDWAGTPELASQLMGMDDLWGGLAAMRSGLSAPAADPGVDAAIGRARAELRRLEAEGVLTLPTPVRAR